MNEVKRNSCELTSPSIHAPIAGMIKPPERPESPKAIADRLVATIDALGLKQSEFADLAGVGRNTLNQWLRKPQRPQIDEALKLCRAHGLTLDWIYLGKTDGLPLSVARLLLRGPIHHAS